MMKASATLAALAAAALVLAGCQDGSLSVPRHLRPVSAETRALMDERQMNAQAPIMIRIFKAEGQLEVWKQQRSGRYALLRSYEICRFSGDLGPKIREGDRQAPEGFYTVTPALMNPNSSYHLAFNVGFPNAFDRAHGRTGSHLMVHGDCSSRGCFAMTNQQIEEIFALARDAFAGGQRGVQLQILPFRMTAENMFRYRRNQHYAFWQNLREGSDHFEATGRPPEVQVCGRRYVFNRRLINDEGRFDPQAACPPSEIPTEIQVPVAQRQQRDAQVFARLERESRQPSAAAMVASLAGSRPVAAASSAPPHHVYRTRLQIAEALPRSAPEALSLLPGAEAGPTDELRRIARGEMIGQPPPATALAAAESTAGAAGPIVAVREEPAARTQLAANSRAPRRPEARDADRGRAIARVPETTVAEAPATTGSVRPQLVDPGLVAGAWQRVQGAFSGFGLGPASAPVSQNPAR
jgi:murein L,D-transpeptidase YafK